jgi:hypothetical protein
MFIGVDVTACSLLQTGRDFELHFVCYNVNGVTPIILIKEGANKSGATNVRGE